MEHGWPEWQYSRSHHNVWDLILKVTYLCIPLLTTKDFLKYWGKRAAACHCNLWNVVLTVELYFYDYDSHLHHNTQHCPHKWRWGWSGGGYWWWMVASQVCGVIPSVHDRGVEDWWGMICFDGGLIFREGEINNESVLWEFCIEFLTAHFTTLF